jgi:hypothetical protein
MEHRHFPILRMRYKSLSKLRKDFFVPVSRARLRILTISSVDYLAGFITYIKDTNERKKVSGMQIAVPVSDPS